MKRAPFIAMMAAAAILSTSIAFGATSATAAKPAVAKPATAAATPAAAASAKPVAAAATPAMAASAKPAAARPAAASAKPARPAAGSTPIDLNSADKAALLKLPGVGEVTAEK